MKSKTAEIPFINVRDFVMFPKMTQGVFIGRQPTIDAIMHALNQGNKKVLVLSQKDAKNARPSGLREMYSLGTVCSVEGSVLLQDGTMKALLSGENLFEVRRLFEKDGVRFACGSWVGVPATKKCIDPVLRTELLELLLRAKPYVALDEDADWFERLKKEGDGHRFLETLQTNLNCRGTSKKPAIRKRKTLPKKEIFLINSKVRLLQQLLEEEMLNKKLELMEKYLKLELSALHPY